MWFQVANAALGIWLMAAPAVLDYGPPAASVDRILGPTVAAVALIAASEVMRGFRLLNVAIGLALLVMPWLLGYETPALANSIAIGAAIILLAIPRGRIKHQIGGGWRSLAE